MKFQFEKAMIIAREKLEKVFDDKNYWPVHPNNRDIKWTQATYSNITKTYSFSFWIDVSTGERNEVIRVSEGEL